MKNGVNGPVRQHFSLATENALTPEPGGPPTSDAFEGPGGGKGNVYGPTTEVKSVKTLVPGEGTSNKSNW